MLIVGVNGTDQSMRDFIINNHLPTIQAIVNPTLATQYRVANAPYAIVLGTDGIVKAKGLVNHLEHLDSLLTAAEIGHPTLEAYIASKRNRSPRAGSNAATIPAVTLPPH